MLRFGVIGVGHRIGYMLTYLPKHTFDAKVTAIADINEEKAKQKAEERPDIYAADTKIYANADEMLDQEKLDGVFIGTRDSLHTEMAIKVIERGLPLFLEKAISTNMEDLKRLSDAAKKHQPKVTVSFPLRFTDIARLSKEIIDSGTIGTVEQIDAFNDVPYGGCYFHDWYRDETETGGLWLQKSTHDFDCINYMMGQTPKKISAVSVKHIFKGDMPAGLKCKDCEKYWDCPESPYMIENFYEDKVQGEYCCFAKDTGNQDCGSAIIKYGSGAIATYTQNFFARHHAARRGGRVYGYKGTLEYDWHQGYVKVFSHTSKRVDTYQYDSDGAGHFGGDTILMKQFLDLVAGKERSYIDEGIISTLMCLKAKEACQSEQFEAIPDISQF